MFLQYNPLFSYDNKIRRYGDEYVTKYDRSSLRKLGSVGEPINIVSPYNLISYQ